MRAFLAGLAAMLVLTVIMVFVLDPLNQPTTEQSVRLGSVHLLEMQQ